MDTEPPPDQGPNDSIPLESLMQNAPDWEQLLTLLNQNERLLQDVLLLMAQESPRLAKDFTRAAESQNCPAAKRAAHTLKSNCRQLGLLNAANFAASLEDLAAQQQVAALSRHSATFRQLGQAIADWAWDMRDRHSS